MTIIEMITLFGVMTALAAIPSASVALVVTRSATLGIANGLAASLGIVLGDLVFILLAILGLSVVAETMGSVFVVIKYLGACYLFWLGFCLLTSKSKTEFYSVKPVQKRDLAASFLAGFILTLGDVKAIFFYISLFPLFIDLSTLAAADVATIVLIMMVAVGGVKAIYAITATKISALAKKYHFESAARKTAGGLMIGAGSYLVAKT